MREAPWTCVILGCNSVELGLGSGFPARYVVIHLHASNAALYSSPVKYDISRTLPRAVSGCGPLLPSAEAASCPQREAAPGGDPGLSCGLSWRFQVTQNDLWELQECLQTLQSQKKPISAPEGARQPVGSSFGPLRNVSTQPRPRAANRQPKLL